MPAEPASAWLLGADKQVRARVCPCAFDKHCVYIGKRVGYTSYLPPGLIGLMHVSAVRAPIKRQSPGLK